MRTPVANGWAGPPPGGIRMMVARGGSASRSCGGDVARRTDREVDRTVGSDGDALQRVRVGAAQIGASLRREARRRPSAGWWPPRWRSRRRRSGRSRRHRGSNQRTPSHGVGRDLRAASTLAAPHRVSASASRSVRSSGSDTSRAPSGVHAARRALGILAHTDIVQPSGTSACRGSSNGLWARSPGTSTGRRHQIRRRRCGRCRRRWRPGRRLRRCARRTPCQQRDTERARRRARYAAARSACISQTRISDGSARGDALAARRGEPDGVTFVKRPGAFERHLAARDEQVQERRFRQLDGVPRLQPCAVQCRAPVVDGDGRTVVHARRDRHQPAGELARRRSRPAGSPARCPIRREPPTSARNAHAHWPIRSSPNAAHPTRPTSAAPGRGRSRRSCPSSRGAPANPAAPT